MAWGCAYLPFAWRVCYAGHLPDRSRAARRASAGATGQLWLGKGQDRMNGTNGRIRKAGMWLVLGPVLALGLAACDSAEERAARHYASALELLEAGDADRALVELRNVFKLQGDHRDARMLYAETQHMRGELADAFGNYLRLVEFYPDDVPARQAMAELAAEVRDWDEAARHATAGLALVPDDPVFRAVKSALDYRVAVQRRNAEARADAVARARALVDAGSPPWSARTVVVDDLVMRGGDAGAALAAVDAALGQRPNDRDMHQARLRLLAVAGDDAATEAQLRRMVELFSEDEGLRGDLIGWYGARGRADEIIAYLRGLAAADLADEWPRAALAQVLYVTEGLGAARAELAAQADAAPTPALALRYRALAARLRFDEGAQNDAIADLRDAVAAAGAAGVAGGPLHAAQVSLASMLREAGDEAAAKAAVAGVLASDSGNVAALQMRAAWAIAEDRTDDAISALRRALAEAPRDPEVMTLMAMAHLRDGSHELARERLSLAVEVSRRGVSESLRYARFLAEAGRYSVAETVLTDALLIHRAEPALLAAQTEVRLQAGEVTRAGQSLARLQEVAETRPDLGPVVARLRAQVMQQAGDGAGALAYLEGLIASGVYDISAVALIVRTHMEAGNPDAAAGYLEGLLAGTPGDLSLLFLRAGVHHAVGEVAEAEAMWRDLIAERPDAEGPVRELYTHLSRTGRADEAEEVLKAALDAQPESEVLRWLLAGAQQMRGDIEGAIASYEALHAANTSNDVFANNLAALLSSHRDDAATLERAQSIARRLRASDVPAFRDTYGWIAFRRGQIDEAVRHLRFAAEGLPENAQVQYHHGRALMAAGQSAAARAALSRALDLGAFPEAEAARAALAQLDAVAGQ